MYEMNDYSESATMMKLLVLKHNISAGYRLGWKCREVQFDFEPVLPVWVVCCIHRINDKPNQLIIFHQTNEKLEDGGRGCQLRIFPKNTYCFTRIVWTLKG
jgi:hypothetical protein